MKDSNFENPKLKEVITESSETKFKKIIVDYTGEKIGKEEVSIEDIIDVLSEEFPEFLFAIAEENWIRGYEQGIIDTESIDDKINT